MKIHIFNGCMHNHEIEIYQQFAVHESEYKI